MKAVERVGVKNLKNNLSAYLRQVRRGVRVLVTDRDEVVAELAKPRERRAAGPAGRGDVTLTPGKSRPGRLLVTRRAAAPGMKEEVIVELEALLELRRRQPPN